MGLLEIDLSVSNESCIKTIISEDSDKNQFENCDLMIDQTQEVLPNLSVKCKCMIGFPGLKT